MEAFLQYLGNHYFEMFFKKIKLFVAQNHDLIEEKFNGKRIGFIGVEDLYFKKVWINDDKNDVISFDVLIYPELNATVKLGYGDEDSQGLNNLLLLCTGTVRISKDLECLKIDSVEEYSSKNPSNKQLDGNLVPYIQKSEYSSCAAEILRKYYPSGLESPRFINIRTVAKNMGLKILNRRIDKNKTVFGQFYFFAGSGKFYDEKKDEYYTEWIPQNTIIVDSSANYLYSYGSENLTIAHECVHAYLHKKAFIFARLAQKDLKCITCNNSGDNRYNNKTLQWVEFQANSIAPYLLTPDTTFKIKIDELFNERLNGENYDPLLDVQEIINDAASFFGITKQSVRKRMIDCGYEEAIGCFNWLDAGYIRPYLSKKGSLKKNETYSIRTNDFYHAMTSNPKILGGIYNGYLVFVENHVIVNHPKYLIDDNGNFILTEYARRHLDECAVKFIVFPKNKQNVNCKMK